MEKTMKDLLLINLCSYPEFSVGEIYPIGLNKIKSYLERRGYECQIYDYHLIPELNIYKILDMNYRYVGISIRNMDTLELDSRIQYKKFMEFINNFYKIKSQNQFSSKVVIGGSGYSLYSEEFNKHIDYDHGIIGNGEIAFEYLLAGTVSEKDIEINESSQEKILYDETLIKAYLAAKPSISIGLQTYEGKCSKSCIYCCYNYKNIQFKAKKKEDILSEIQQLRSLQVKNIYIVDQVFNITDEYAINILRYIKKDVVGIKIMAFLNPSKSIILYELLKECNVFAIYSFDSFSETVLSRMQKGFTVNEIITTIRLCRRYNVEFSCSLILGALGETEDTILETCKFINEYIEKPSELCLGFGIRIIPKSALYYLLKENDKNFLEPIFVYFSPDIFDFFYRYVNLSKIPIETFLKHSHYKKAYFTRKFIKVE